MLNIIMSQDKQEPFNKQPIDFSMILVPNVEFKYVMQPDIIIDFVISRDDINTTHIIIKNIDGVTLFEHHMRSSRILIKGNKFISPLDIYNILGGRSFTLIKGSPCDEEYAPRRLLITATGTDTIITIADIERYTSGIKVTKNELLENMILKRQEKVKQERLISVAASRIRKDNDETFNNLINKYYDHISAADSILEEIDKKFFTLD